jgi:hypothetical protein
MMKMVMNFPLGVALALTSHCGPLLAHDHLAAGAASTTPGAPLVFANDATFGGDSGFVFNLSAGATNSPYWGYFYTEDLVFASLAATPDFGGPDPGAAALGAHVQAQLLSVEGPLGARFGFWETAQDGVDSTNLTWSVPAPYGNGTNLISVSENDASPAADPYGHIHGRIYTVTEPGLYKVTWRFLDTSANGPNGGPVCSPSVPFYLYYQAGLTLGKFTPGTNGLNITFAAPSNLPDSGEGPATNYTLEGSPALGLGEAWEPVNAVVVGDDHLHSVTVPWNGSVHFFRLSAD